MGGRHRPSGHGCVGGRPQGPRHRLRDVQPAGAGRAVRRAHRGGVRRHARWPEQPRQGPGREHHQGEETDEHAVLRPQGHRKDHPSGAHVPGAGHRVHPPRRADRGHALQSPAAETPPRLETKGNTRPAKQRVLSRLPASPATVRPHPHISCGPGACAATRRGRRGGFQTRPRSHRLVARYRLLASTRSFRLLFHVPAQEPYLRPGQHVLELLADGPQANQ